MKIEKKLFGTTKDGQKVYSYCMENKKGMKVTCLDFGAVVTSIIVPDKNGVFKDVALGYANIAGYEKNDPALGGFIGRCANRIGNAEFELNGVTYQLQKNDGKNCLHGGDPAYRKQMYEAEPYQEEDAVGVEFTRLSPDMEQGFPGNFDISVTYTLTEDNELLIEYCGVSDQDTIVNLTNHSYFNLAGHNSGSVLNHKVQLFAEQFTPTDAGLIPTGEYRDVADTPLDFREMKKIGQDINAEYEPLVLAGGYDHNFVLNHEGNDVDLAAKYYDEESGRLMEVFTDFPGLQMYTANFLEESENCKENAVYHKRDAVCFETQFFPNACNIPAFPSTVLKADKPFEYTTVYKFSVK